MNQRKQPAAGSARRSAGRLTVRNEINNAVTIAVLVGCITFSVGAVVTILTTHFFPGTLMSLFADDLIIGASTGLVVFLYEQRRNRFLLDRLRIIQEVNHHVRNALQVISSVTDRHEDEQLRTMVRDSSERIQWVLREILEGEEPQK